MVFRRVSSGAAAIGRELRTVPGPMAPRLCCSGADMVGEGESSNVGGGGATKLGGGGATQLVGGGATQLVGPGPMALHYRPLAGSARRADMVGQGESSNVSGSATHTQLVGGATQLVPALARIGPSTPQLPVAAATKVVPIEINPEIVVKIMEPHLEELSKKVLRIMRHEMQFKESSSFVLGTTMEWASFVANSLRILSATLVLGVLAYSQLHPVEFRKYLDGVIHDISRSAEYGLTRGILGETLAGKYMKAVEAKKKSEEQKRRQLELEAERRKAQEERLKLEEEYKRAVQNLTLYEFILYRANVGGMRWDWGGTRRWPRGRRWVIVDGVGQRW